MAITPYTTPTQYQYKPLNLMAFAEPLMKMQEKYDLVKASLDEADVKATALQWAEDPQKAKALENLYRTKRDELIANLMETKNYTQAASKLKQLNKLWTEDPERIALETNYKTWEERNKEELARVGKPISQGGISKEDYLDWFNREKAAFISKGGTSYTQDASAPTGTYNVVTGKIGRETNLQEDFDKIKLDLAKAAPGEKRAGVLRALGLEELSGDAQFVQSVIEEKDPNKVAANVERYLRTLDRFKPWLSETADYKFYNLSQKPEQLQGQVSKIANNVIASIDRQLAQMENKNSDEYKNLLAYKEELQAGQAQGFDQETARRLFEADFYNQKYSADEVAQIFGYKNIDNNYTFRDVSAPGTGTGSGSNPLLSEIGRTDPTTKELSVVDLVGLRASSTKQMVPNLKENNNLGGGWVRAIIAGNQGTELRSKLSATPGLMAVRQEKFLAVLENSKNINEFKRGLAAAGLNTDISSNAMNTVWAAFHGQNGTNNIQKFKNNLQEIAGARVQFEDAYNQLQYINENVGSTKEFKTFVDTNAKERLSVSKNDVEKLAKQWNTTVDKLVRSGVVTMTSSGAYADGMDVTTYTMSANNLAKAHGFKGLQEAVQEGFNFSSVGQSKFQSSLNSAKQEAVDKNFGGQMMGVRIVGNKNVDQAFSVLLANPSELTNYVPAHATSWGAVEGFTEKGSPASGTQLDESTPPRIVMRGNKVTVLVSYKFKDEDGNMVTKNVEVVPRKGHEALLESSIRYVAQLNYQTKDSNQLNKQTYEDTMVGLYNISSNSNLTEASGAATQVTASRPRAVVETRLTGTPGSVVQIVKDYNGGNPVYRAFVVSAAGGKQDLGIKAGSVNAVKVAVAEQMDLVEKPQ